MTLTLLLALFLAALALGVAMHVALYAPTAALPPMWRNLTRYALGVTAVHMLIAVAIVLAPDMALWSVFALSLTLAAMTGISVALGYLVIGD